MAYRARLHLQFAAIAWLAACRTPLGLVPAPVHLEIANPARLSLALDVVDGDVLQPLVELGGAATHRLDLLPGAYVVRVRAPDDTFALPAPLFAIALPADRTLHLAIAARPAAAADAPEFAFVPGGPAVVGDTLGIGQEDERPPRLVDVPAFWLARREVTNAQFAAFLNECGGEPDPTWCAFDSRKFRIVRSADGQWATDAPTLPVVTVSLAGAEAYCAWRTRATGVRHRLPREVEWEKAARGPASCVYAYGNVYRRRAANQESGALRAVALAPADGFGLYDLTGNAFEWTSDAYPGGAPGPDGRAEFQVLRGGSFVLDGMYLRNSFRMRQRPDVRTDDIGFRVARDLVDSNPR